MSGAVAAHAAYNGSGTQGLAVTNKIHDDDGDVMSVFWNKNDTTRQLLYGSAVVEVPASGGSGTVTVGSNSSIIFDVNNDIDCLGDMFIKVSYKAGQNSSTLGREALAAAVGRVEVMVGTQIWQTFEKEDLMALAATEISSGSFQDYTFQASGGVQNGNQFSNDVPTTAPTHSLTDECFAYIPLKMLTKTLGPRLENFAEQSESGYLMAAAPHQQVKVKIFSDSTFNDGHTSSASTLKFFLYAKNQVMCNEEREQIKAMPMGLPKRIKMTQNKNQSVGTAINNIEFDLDHFSLYASHIIISFPSDNQNTDLRTLLKGLNNTHAELLLNSSSYSGKLPLGLLKITGPSMGLYTNEYFINNENTSRFITFVFPLASRAYGGSSVPLNRFDNIRLKLSFGSTALYTSGTTSHVNVTCVGETTALYKGGAASLAMY